MTLKKRRRLLRREPTNYTARAGMGEYRIRKRGESDNERKEMRSSTMQTQFDKIRTASPMMEAQKKESMPTAKGKPTPPSRPNKKDDVVSTKGKGATGTQSGPSPKGNQKKLDANKDGKLTAEDLTSDTPKQRGGRVLTRKRNLERLRKARELRKKQEEEKKKRKTDQRGRSR